MLLWKGKEESQDQKNRKEEIIRSPGELISVDQMNSSDPGLVAQMTGNPTRERYQVATIFVDKATGFSQVYPQKSTSAQETIESKRQFEIYSRNNGVEIKSYRSDNGIFATKEWKQECNNNNQATKASPTTYSRTQE